MVEAGSISRAAAALHISQPALSQQIRGLEQSLHTQLLERSSRGARPTGAGRALYRDAFRLVREFDQLAASAASIDEVRGVVSVGLPSGAASRLAAPLTTWTLRNLPGIRLELFESMSGYIAELYNSGRMDLALFYESVHDITALPAASADQIPLYEEVMYAFGGLCGDLQRTEGSDQTGCVTLERLATLPLVAPGLRSSLRRLIDAAFHARGLTPTIAADLESLPTMLEIAQNGSAYAILPLSTAQGSSVPRFSIADAPLRRRAVMHVSRSRATSPEALAAVQRGLLHVVDEAIGADTGLLPVSG